MRSASSRSCAAACRGHRPRSRAQVVAFVQRLRTLDLYKLPGLSETIEWGRALLALERQALDPQTIDDTLGLLLKHQDDITQIQGPQTRELLQSIGTGSA